jgi:hypothetical protein
VPGIILGGAVTRRLPPGSGNRHPDNKPPLDWALRGVDMDSNAIDGSTFKLYQKGTTTQIAAQVSYNASTDTAKLDPTKTT